MQRLAKRERKSESVNEAETESDHPSALDIAADNVFQGHVENRNGDERFDQRWKPQRVRTKIECRRNQRDRMRHRKRRDDRDERPPAAEWNHEAEEKQQVIGSIENVVEAHLDESRGGLVPPRIQPHQPRISQEFEGAHDTCRRQELQCRDDAQSQTFITRMNRKLRLIGLDRIVHQHVEHDLIPKDIRGVG